MRIELSGLVAALLVVGCASSRPAPMPAAPAVIAETQELVERDQDLGGLNAVVGVLLRNPGPSALTATRAAYELVSEGRILDRGEVALGDRVIPAGGASRLEIVVPFRYAPTEDDLQVLLNRKAPLEYAVRGTISVGAATVEFARASRVKTPRLPVLTLAAVEAIHSSAQGLTMNASYQVENPNPFPVKLPGLQWSLAVAEEAAGEGVVGRNATLKPASTTRYEVSLNLDSAELGRRKLKLAGSLTYRAQGEIDLATTVVRLDQGGKTRVLRDGD